MFIVASRMARAAIAKAMAVTNFPFFGITPSSISRDSKSGVVITKTASITTVNRKKVTAFLYGVAKEMIRLRVPALSFVFLTD